MQLGVNQLPLVWNALWDAGEDRIAVEHPAEALAPLCEVTLGETVTLRPQQVETYAAARTAAATEWGEDVAAELPRASSMCGAYLAAGVIAPANAAAIAETVEATGGADLTAGHRPVMVGFDTNLLAWRPHAALGATAGTDAPYDGYALATGVRDELRWDAKVSDTHRLERAFGTEFTELWNQPAGQRREGRLAEVMYRRLRDRREGTEVQTATGDDAIIEGYDTMRTDQRCDVVLFSADRDFIERAQGHRIPGAWVELPRTLPARVQTDWAGLGRLVYHLAVLFGVLRLPRMTLYGVWRGKPGQAWTDQTLQVECRSPVVRAQLERDLAICEADGSGG